MKIAIVLLGFYLFLDYVIWRLAGGRSLGSLIKAGVEYCVSADWAAAKTAAKQRVLTLLTAQPERCIASALLTVVSFAPTWLYLAAMYVFEPSANKLSWYWLVRISWAWKEYFLIAQVFFIFPLLTVMLLLLWNNKKWDKK